jgi:HlyD family secretion protein
VKRLLFWLAIGVVIVGAGTAGYSHFYGSKSGDAGGKYRTMEVRRGDVVYSVPSTGTVQPVQSVQVGSFVSGPVQTVHVDFNAKVKKGQLLANVDPLLFNAQRSQAQASLDCASANLLQAEAKLKQAARDWKRAESLRPAKAISETDYDLAQATYDAAQANVAVAKATIEQNKAALKLIETNLEYTNIKSPVDGVVTDRKVDSGQTMASQFQTPVMFVVAKDLEKNVYVSASVDEADIGMIRDAQARNQPVTFTVDAYPNDLFQGKIYDVRLNFTTTQNVVTYPVIVDTPNDELKLLPGMTASLSFQIDEHKNVLQVPNAALRFYPKPEQVRTEDRALLEGEDQPTTENGEARAADAQRSAAERAEAGRTRNRRHVWVVDGDFLKAVEIVTGLSDSKYSEIVSGTLKEGESVVTGLASPKP